jgi:hypothetical protein
MKRFTMSTALGSRSTRSRRRRTHEQRQTGDERGMSRTGRGNAWVPQNTVDVLHRRATYRVDGKRDQHGREGRPVRRLEKDAFEIGDEQLLDEHAVELASQDDSFGPSPTGEFDRRAGAGDPAAQGLSSAPASLPRLPVRLASVRGRALIAAGIGGLGVTAAAWSASTALRPDGNDPASPGPVAGAATDAHREAPMDAGRRQPQHKRPDAGDAHAGARTKPDRAADLNAPNAVYAPAPAVEAPTTSALPPAQVVAVHSAFPPARSEPQLTDGGGSAGDVRMGEREAVTREFGP